MNHNKSIIVLGGGISGLAAAWKLRDRDVLLIEKSPRLGGWIQTIEKDGFLFELGPRSCRTYGNGVATLKLIEELDLQNEIISAAPAAQKRYLLNQKKLQKLPSGLFELLRSPYCYTFVRALFQDLTTSRIHKDCSVADFIRSRFGNDVLQMFMSPLVSGVYAGDPSQLSIESSFPSLYETQYTYGSLIKGMVFNQLRSPKAKVSFPLFSLKRGLNSLVDQLADKIGSSRIKLNSTVTLVEKTETGWKIELDSGESYNCSRIISTLPAHATEKLWGFKAPPLASVAVVNLGYRNLETPYSGFGYLVPEKEHENILGVVWDSKVFPEQQKEAGQTKMTVMIGGMTSPQGWKQWDFKNIALEAIKKHMGINQVPDVIHVTVAENAIPQYEVGFRERKEKFLEDAKLRYPGVTFSGALFDGVSINDCIAAQLYQK